MAGTLVQWPRLKCLISFHNGAGHSLSPHHPPFPFSFDPPRPSQPLLQRSQRKLMPHLITSGTSALCLGWCRCVQRHHNSQVRYWWRKAFEPGREPSDAWLSERLLSDIWGDIRGAFGAEDTVPAVLKSIFALPSPFPPRSAHFPTALHPSAPPPAIGWGGGERDLCGGGGRRGPPRLSQQKGDGGDADDGKPQRGRSEGGSLSQRCVCAGWGREAVCAGESGAGQGIPIVPTRTPSATAPALKHLCQSPKEGLRSATWPDCRQPLSASHRRHPDRSPRVKPGCRCPKNEPPEEIRGRF